MALTYDDHDPMMTQKQRIDVLPIIKPILPNNSALLVELLQ